MINLGDSYLVVTLGSDEEINSLNNLSPNEQMSINLKIFSNQVKYDPLYTSYNIGTFNLLKAALKSEEVLNVKSSLMITIYQDSTALLNIILLLDG